MRGKQLDNGIDVDPDLAVALLLRLVEDQLQAEMQVHRFDIVYVLTNGGPGHATEVLTTYAFQLYSRGQYGMSSALNTVLLVITAIIGAFIVKTLRKQEVQQ